MSNSLSISPLAHTWIFDVDGTVVKHNGHETNEPEKPLPGVVEFFKSLPEQDKIIFLTARSSEYAEVTEKVLCNYGIRFDEIIYGVPNGERILINDKKPSGMKCAVAINLKRDQFDMPLIEVDSAL